MPTFDDLKNLALSHLDQTIAIEDKERTINYVLEHKRKQIASLPAGLDRSTRLLEVNNEINVSKEDLEVMKSQLVEIKEQLLPILHEGEFPKTIELEYEAPLYFTLSYDADGNIETTTPFHKIGV